MRHASRLPHRGSGLFVRYALASLVPVLLLGGVLLHFEQGAGLERGLSQGRAQAAVIEQMAIAPALESHDLERGLSTIERAQLQQATDLAIFSGSISRLRLRAFTGQVVFSDDGMNASPVSAHSTAFRAASAGKTDVDVVADETDRHVQAIRVLQPVVPGATGQAVGVLELTMPYAPISAVVHRQQRAIYQLLTAGLAALYLVLAGISWSTTRRLRRYAATQAYEAMHDALTGLPNRALFRQRAEAAVSDARPEEPGAVVLIDLDRFKEVNDSLGHHAGDALLEAVAKRLTEDLRTDDTVARLGGDEFGLVLPDVGSVAKAVELLGRVRTRLGADLDIDGVTLSIEASFGVAVYPEHGRDLETLLRHADAAMYASKRGAGGVVVHRAEATDHAGPGLALRHELHQAIEHDELVLRYQPKVDLRLGQVISLEALLMWAHPQRGLLAADAFLPAADLPGLIEPLTTWTLEHALADHAAWSSAGMSATLAVTFSARNLASPGLAVQVRTILARTGTPANELCIEVTETALTCDPFAAGATLAALAEAGVGVSIDHVGTGCSSLIHLRAGCISEIKIGREFVQNLPHQVKDRAIVESVIELAHGLGVSVTAEGVETAATAHWLRAAGCDLGQGSHFSHPVPWPDLLPAIHPRACAPVPIMTGPSTLQDAH